jgi:pilus assembly protein Flp/PilA
MRKFFRDILIREDGATAIEYGLIAALVSVAGIVALQSVGVSISGLFDTVSTTLSTAVGGP